MAFLWATKSLNFLCGKISGFFVLKVFTGVGVEERGDWGLRVQVVFQGGQEFGVCDVVAVWIPRLRGGFLL